MNYSLKLFLYLSIYLSVIVLPACSSSTPIATEPVDVVGTSAAQFASVFLTQTSAAQHIPTATLYPGTPVSSPVSAVTVRPTPVITSIPKVKGEAACYLGPDSSYPLVSNITESKEVEVVGVAHVPGWIVIRNPYFGSLCWIPAANLNLESDFDLSTLPTIMP